MWLSLSRYPSGNRLLCLSQLCPDASAGPPTAVWCHKASCWGGCVVFSNKPCILSCIWLDWGQSRISGYGCLHTLPLLKSCPVGLRGRGLVPSYRRCNPISPVTPPPTSSPPGAAPAAGTARPHTYSMQSPQKPGLGRFRF